MLGFIARSVIAITVGTVFLIAMLLALAGDALQAPSNSRRMQTLPRRNRSVMARSEVLTAEEMQS